MRHTLSHIATVGSGIYEKTSGFGEVQYLQSRHFDRNHQFDSSIQPELTLHKKLEKHLLKEGDILLTAKGFDHYAVMYKSEMGQAVASTVFLVIRLLQENILPEYVTWFLNSPDAQKQLMATSKGSSIHSISKGEVEKLIIPIPSEDKQAIIIQLQQLRSRELKIKNKLEELRENLLHQQITEAIIK